MSEVEVDDLAVSVFRVPTDAPEADGTLAWDSTTAIVVEVSAGGETGLGLTYANRATGTMIVDELRDAVVGADAMNVPAAWSEMVKRTRNLGRPGVTSTAIAAVDLGLWDLAARLVGLPLVDLLGATRDDAPVYGSGGFTSYDHDRLRQQLAGWVHDDGIPRVKMKIGTDWGRRSDDDIARIAVARDAIGPDAELFVDANGAYSAKQAVRLCGELEAQDVTWFEEPVSSDDLVGLRTVRAGTGIDVAAGEYGYDLVYFERMCAAGAVDVLQADVTRCAGITEWCRAAAVAAAHGLDLSGHCAPSMHLHPACAVQRLRHLEYFHDHVRIEHLLFDGVVEPVDGVLRPDRGRPGNGLTLRPDLADLRLDVQPMRLPGASNG